MVDRKKRDLLIKKFRELLSGSITNLEYDDFEDKFASDDDPATWLIWEQTWRLYDDFKEHKVELTQEGRQYFARCILFLYSDLEYEWPYPTFKHKLKRIATVLTLGLIPCFKESKYSRMGCFVVWPFFRKDDFERAKRNNKFLYKEIAEDSEQKSEAPPNSATKDTSGLSEDGSGKKKLTQP